MKRKAKILLISYVSVLVVALALYAWAGQWGLGWYRRTVGESASLAYEETVRSVETLSQVLAKSPYATDPEMCDRICCEAYACAAAAESAMSTLPFSTWELEQLSGFLNTSGDYAYSLCGQGQAFTDKQRQELRELAASAAEFSETLLTLREDLENRELTMDSREQRLQNVGTETGPRLSGELLAYEAASEFVSRTAENLDSLLDDLELISDGIADSHEALTLFLRKAHQGIVGDWLVSLRELLELILGIVIVPRSSRSSCLAFSGTSLSIMGVSC